MVARHFLLNRTTSFLIIEKLTKNVGKRYSTRVFVKYYLESTRNCICIEIIVLTDKIPNRINRSNLEEEKYTLTE